MSSVILDAWSRRVVGYAISRSIDARLTVVALKAALEAQKPPPVAFITRPRVAIRRAALSRDFGRPWLRRLDGTTGNPYDNAKAESFMKTLKVEAVYPMAYETSPTLSRTSAFHRRESTTAAGSTPPSVT